ncbi:MAG: hypothetical protein IKT40_10575 [Bacilli bacterium]|nr:hypothetical protein [Bacilli bacterium]
MKKLFKRIIPCLLLVLSLITILSCDQKDEYKYPNPVPLYTADGTFVQIGNLKVSKQDIYNRLIQSYGIEEFENIIDAELLKDIQLNDKQEKDFQEQMTNLIYGTTDLDELDAEEKAEAEKSFKVELMSNGLHNDESKKDDPLYYENYYRLDYKRYLKTVEVLKQEIKEHDEELEEDEEPYFTDSEYVSYFNNNFRKHYKLIIVTFESEKEAKAVMAEAGIKTDKLAANWSNAAGELSDAQIVEAFKAMYKTVYNQDCEGAQEYTYEDLIAIQGNSAPDGIIANKAANLKDKEYTHAPIHFSGRYFLMYAEEVGKEYINIKDETFKFADSEEWIAEKNASNVVSKLTDAAKEALFDSLVEAELGNNTTAYENNINRVMYELRQEAGLEIFAEGLEITYKSNYNSVFSALDITEYDEFNATKNTSNKEVVKWNNGSITVEQMYDALTKRYGAVITLLFVQQYAVLGSKHNTIINYATGEILDQEAYDEYLEEDLEAYKESFEDGDFESYGYPASYGWTNFLRDYLGLSEEAAIIVDFNSSLYEAVLDLYKKSLYMVEVGEVELVVLTDAEGKKTWGIKSEKWSETHDSGVEVVDENTKPTITIAWNEADIEGLPEKDANDKPIVYKAENYYGHFILTTKEGKFLTPVTADQAVLEVYDEIYNDTFSATATGLYVYYDLNNDGVADEVEEANAADAKALVEKVWEEAKKESSEKTIATNLNTVVRRFELAGPTESEWFSFKQKGLRVTVISGTTYSNASSADEKILETIKGMWTLISEYRNPLGTSQNITGQTLDPLYRYVSNEKVYTVGAYEFADKFNAIYADNGYYQFAVTKASSRTAYQYSTTTKTQKPSLYIYEQYLLDKDDREITINCSSQITTYYTPAINKLSGSSVINKELMNQAKVLLSQVTFTDDANGSLKASLTFLVDAAIEELE